jgi:hypothetical protein
MKLSRRSADRPDPEPKFPPTEKSPLASNSVLSTWANPPSVRSYPKEVTPGGSLPFCEFSWRAWSRSTSLPLAVASLPPDPRCASGCWLGSV